MSLYPGQGLGLPPGFGGLPQGGQMGGGLLGWGGPQRAQQRQPYSPPQMGGGQPMGGGFLSRLSQQMPQQQSYGGGFMPQQRSPFGMMGGMSPYGFGGGMSPFMGGYNPFGGFGFGRMF
jgi:hypothetical protein